MRRYWIAHAHVAAPVDQGHVNLDQPALLAGIDTVAHRILDQRQQGHRRTGQRFGRRIDAHLVAQPVGGKRMRMMSRYARAISSSCPTVEVLRPACGTAALR